MKSISDIRIQLRDRFVRFYTDDLVRISRRRRANQLFQRKAPYSQPLTQAQKDEIIAFWKPYRDIEKEIKWFAFYSCFCGEKERLECYVPDSVFYTDVDMFYTDVRRCYELDDKNLYDLYFADVVRPTTVVRKCNGELMDKDYHAVTIDQAMRLCHRAGRVIYKPSRNSQGGHGIYFYDMTTPLSAELESRMQGHQDFILQEVVSQHECLNRIHDKSVNTVRIMTFCDHGTVDVLSSVLRMGRDGSRVDNASSGGIFCGIDGDGRLKEFAYDTKGNRWTQHPQGTVFKDYEIVGYDKCCELVKSLAGRFCTASKLLSWDLAIGIDGAPIVIEVNMTFGQIDFHQMCNGPIFGDRTAQVLQQVYGHKN